MNFSHVPVLLFPEVTVVGLPPICMGDRFKLPVRCSWGVGSIGVVIRLSG